MGFGDNLASPALAYLRAALGVHVAALRAAWRNSDRGASAVELAVITAIILAAAVFLALLISRFVHKEAKKIHA